MANTLLSPGVQVTVVDESQYLPAATNSVPLIVLATASNKANAAGTGIAAGTLNVNADKLFLATSQRALLAQYGNPLFYTTTNGTPINGYELNEYGLLAAYSALGVTNQCYILRADIDLSALTASLVRPKGAPADGEFWLDATNTLWGLFQWNQATGVFTNEIPLVITDPAYLTDMSTVPLNTYGSIGNYAVTATSTSNPIYFKRGGPTSTQTNDTNISMLFNTWVLVGSNDWQTSWATVQGQNTPSTLTPGDTFTINSTYSVTVPGSPNDTVTGLVDAITAANIPGVHVANIGGALNIYANNLSASNGSTVDGKVAITGTPALLTALGITASTYYAPQYQPSPSYTVPQWNKFSTSPMGGAPTGSVWQKTNTVNLGTDIVLSRYNSTIEVFVKQSCPLYANDAEAIYALDPSGGGQSIPATSTYAQYEPLANGTAGLVIYERFITGPTLVTGGVAFTGTGTPFTPGNSFTISGTEPGTAALTTVTVSIGGTGTVSDFIAAVSSANISYVSTKVNSSGYIVFEHSKGGDIYLTNVTGTPITTAGFTNSTALVKPLYTAGTETGLILSNWIGSPTFSYTAATAAPYNNPTTGTYWYYSDPTQVDIMIQNNGVWVGYQTVTSDARGYNLSLCNAAGPIISTTAPTTQTDSAASPLQYGDLWVNTGDLENYPLLYRWQNVGGVAQWVQISNTDQTTSNGILFQDARWAPNGTTNPVDDPLPPIENLLTSNYLDPDAPQALLYPSGMLLWNTRRSGFNVKTFELDAWNQQAWPTYDWTSTTPYTIGQYVQYSGLNYACIQNNTNEEPDTSPTYWALQDQFNTWNSATGSRPDGSPYMGRQSQRAIIVEALKAAIDTNPAIREEQNSYNLIAVTGYPELAPNMAELNNEINNVAFAIIDTPLRLTPDNIATWASNNDGLGLATADGNLASGDSYGGTFYPSCRTTDLSGNTAVTYPSHMMIRTIIRSDEVAYPWLAPAGTRRGLVDNALQLGYLNGITGIFEPLGVGQALRDVLYPNHINPITFIPGVGIVNFGNLTLQVTATALDRINVARLVSFIRGRLVVIGKQYLFEPNDTITRTEIKNSITSMLLDIVSKRGIYDYLVVCDNTNNTPTTIDENQLWVDIAIEPVKAVEFIYIPMRIEATGAIAAQAIA